MTNQEIIEGNKLIAVFMNLPFKLREWDEKESWLYYDNYWRITESLKYHSSWDWLMPVVEKISAYEYEDGVTAYPRTFGMPDEHLRQPLFRFNRMGLFSHKKLIVATWYAVVDFIKWHNENQKP